MSSITSLKADEENLTQDTSLDKLTQSIIYESKRIKKPSKKKMQKLIKKSFGFSVPRLFDTEHKYLIRGDIIIDIDCIKKNNIYTWNCLDYKEYRPPKAVRFLKEHKFYQIEFGRIQNPIRDFQFVIDMLNSLGDQKIHYLAEQLKEYKNVYDLIDRLQLTYRITPSTNEMESALKSNICSLYRPENEGEWTYEMSLAKASQIIQKKQQSNKFLFYTILKGNYDQYEIAILGVQEQALKLIFGNIDTSEMTKILLENGLIMMNRSILELISNRTQANKNQLDGLAEDKEYSTFTKEITSYSINNYLFKLNVKFERFRLSNYKDRFNDYLVVGDVNDEQILNLANQLFVQKVFLNQAQDEREMLANISYTAQSEYFIEKFYPKEEEEDKARSKQNKVQFEHLDIPNKQCGYKVIFNKQ